MTKPKQPPRVSAGFYGNGDPKPFALGYLNSLRLSLFRERLRRHRSHIAGVNRQSR